MQRSGPTPLLRPKPWSRAVAGVFLIPSCMSFLVGENWSTQRKPRQTHRIKCTHCTEKTYVALVGFKPSTFLNCQPLSHFAALFTYVSFSIKTPIASFRKLWLFYMCNKGLFSLTSEASALLYMVTSHLTFHPMT